MNLHVRLTEFDKAWLTTWFLIAVSHGVGLIA